MMAAMPSILHDVAAADVLGDEPSSSVTSVTPVPPWRQLQPTPPAAVRQCTMQMGLMLLSMVTFAGTWVIDMQVRT